MVMMEEAMPDTHAGHVRYRPGSVMRVEVKNFMTYSNCVIEPGPTLNLVLGPNGTGKSSFVCALCVGLAGSTKLLGRADDIASFIRRGTDEGEVTVTLADDRGGKLVVRRRMRRSSNGAQNEWWVNGKSSTMTKVKQIVSKYNIQLDNLCQFLPQDKVSEFARMKPVELLKATEMAIGDGHLHNLHESLIKEKKDLDEKKKLVDMASAAVERHEEELGELERALGPMREKKRLKEQMDVLQKHKAWRECDLCEEEGKKEEEMLKKSTATLTRLNKEADSITKGPVKVKSDQKKKTEQAKNAAVKEMGKHNVAKVSTDVENHLTLAQGVHDKVQNLEEASNKWKSKIRMIENDAQNLRETVAQLSHQSDEKVEREIDMLDRQLKDLINQEATLGKSRRELEDDREKLKRAITVLRDQLARENNKKYKALNNLANSRPGVREIYDYVQHNKGRFKGQVLGPLVMEIDVQKKHYASILEQLLPFNWLSYVFVQYEADMKLLKKELEARNIEPLIAVVEADLTAPLQRACGDSSKYASLGVEATLDETFQAHPMIKHALDNHFFISSILVMAEGQHGWQQVFDANPKLQQVWTTEYQVRKTVSQYDASSTTMSFKELKAARILNVSSSSGADAKIKKELDEQMTRLERIELEYNEMQPEVDRIKTHKSEITSEKARLLSIRSDAAQRLKNAKGSLKAKLNQLQIHKSREDPLNQKDKLVQDLRLHLAKALDKAAKMPTVMGKYKDALLKHATNDLQTKELTEQIHVLGQKSKTKLKERNDMAELVDQLQESVNRHREKVERLKQYATEETGWPIPDELQQEFNLLPQDLKEIDEQIAEKKAQHDSILISDPGAQQRYERITEILSTNKEKLEEHQESFAAISDKVEQLKQAWAPEVRSLVQQINSNFSEAFKKVGIAGEVVFNEVDGEDFAKYSIDLRVKFREEGQLMTLDSAYHSGGESSTSTILYLMALQGVTTSPFRVVDEINQGMDSINERSVFKLLADAATAPDTPQCFLLTPKLLPDLPFSEEVTVLQIMNGVHIGEIANGFRQDCLLGQARTTQVVEAV